MAGIVLVVLIVVIALGGLFLYNGLIAKKNKADEAFSGIDVALKKRYDLIPNLVETVKAYMKHERETLVEITELRTRAMSGGISPNEQIRIGNQVNRLGRGLMLQVENYPDLKASTNFMQLQGSWNEVEEQLSAARRTYNAAVTSYNNGVEQFPSSIFAKNLGYQLREFIEIPETERQNISAKELFNS